MKRNGKLLSFSKNEKWEYENGLNFIWDSQKDQANYLIHGIWFSDAKFVFFDENRIEVYDNLHSLSEDRYIVIGYVRNVLTIIYTERGSDIRIISARRASKEEEELYYDYT